MIGVNDRSRISKVLSIMMKYYVASSKKTLNIANSLRLECKNHTQFETKMTKIDTVFLTKMSLKNHILLGWTYPYSPYKGVRPSLLGQSQMEVSQINTFRSVLLCNKLELIYRSFFSTIGSVLYLASTKNPRLWQLSETRTVQSSPLAQIPFTPGLLTHKTSNPSPSQTEHLSGNETPFPSEK